MFELVSGDPLNLKSFTINDEILTPDSGNVVVSCTDQSGVVVHSSTVSFDAVYSIPQGLLNVSNEGVLSFFNLKVNFESGGQSYIFRSSIRANLDFQFIYNSSHVRGILGVTQEELIDSDIDLYVSLNELVLESGYSLFDEDYLIINEVVKYHEALRQISSLSLKILQKDETGDEKRTRMSCIDLKELRSNISTEYFKYKQLLSSSESFPEDLLVEFISRTDVITGES